MSLISSAIYFPGLNGLRGIASLIVIFFHIDQFSRLFHIQKFGFHMSGMAGYAVDLFFVLSGFLITYLLISEKQKNGFINLKAFYLRRILRIWPVYYLAVGMAFLFIILGIVPQGTDEEGSFSLYLFFLANITYVYKNAIDSIAHLWSVSVEEQFYIFWPLVLVVTSKYLRIFVFFFFGFLLVKLCVYLVLTPESDIYYLVHLSSFSIMAMGAIGAYLVFIRHPLLDFFFRLEIQLIAWGVFIFSVIIKPLHIFTFIDQEINSFFYLIIILNVSSNKNTILSLENRVMDFLGKISYGMYTYHLLMIYMIAHLLNYFHIQITHIMLYPLIVICTIGFSVVSYLYLELPVRNLNTRFRYVRTTDNRSLN